MSDAQSNSAVLEDLEDLFSWNPPPFRLATKEMGGSLSTVTRPPGWYDKHLASNRICKKIVHVRDLHRRVAAIVDEKLQAIRNRGIILPPPTARGYIDKEDRQLKMLETGNPAQNELSIQEYYRSVTAQFCLFVASTLALHPHIWRSAITWSLVPIAQGDAVSDGSLRLLFSLNTVKRERDQTIKNIAPYGIDADLWQDLMEINNKYGDMAIWETKSLSVGDGAFMLGIMALATDKEKFQWLLCKGGEDHRWKSKSHGHYPLSATQLEDDPEIMSKFGFDSVDSGATSDLAVNVILDQALSRGGSSLKRVQEFDRKLMQEAKGIVQEDTEQTEGKDIENPLPKGRDSGSGPSHSALPGASQGGRSSVKATGFLSFARWFFGKQLQDELGSFSATADSPQESPKSALPEPSRTSTVKGSKKRDLNIFIPPHFKLKRKASRKRSPSKSPRKMAHARKKDRQTENLGGNGEGKADEEEMADGDGDGGEDGCEGEGEPPLTAQSVLQQAWAQGVHSQSTILIIHSGNYEYVCFRHRATQTLYVSDVLHVPFLRDPGYGKLQVGIYIAAIEDALARHRLEKDLSARVSPPDGDEGQDPSETGHDSSCDSDDDDENHDNDQHRRKRRRGRDQDGQGTTDRNLLDWAMWQARSENGLAIHLIYSVYNSIHPALFDRLGNRGDGRLDLRGLLTPPTSPLNSPGNSPPFSPPTLSSPTVKKGESLALFLTSEIGLRTSGVLHGGVAEVDVGQQTASLKVTVKLAFVKKHQDKLFHELSVYNHLASKDTKGIPPVFGIFHNARDNGPYCLVLRDAGLSIHDRNDPRISISHIHKFDEVLKAIHDAGIVHGNIRLDNLLINDSGDVGIVDFDHARLSYDAKEHERERQSLAGLLKAVLP